MRKRLECILHGEVQGVSLRDFTKSTAKDLGLVGTVKNLPDETVEIIAEGEEQMLKELLFVLREKHPFAKISEVDEQWSESVGEFSDFRILKS